VRKEINSFHPSLRWGGRVGHALSGNQTFHTRTEQVIGVGRANIENQGPERTACVIPAMAAVSEPSEPPAKIKCKKTSSTRAANFPYFLYIMCPLNNKIISVIEDVLPS
jgi:hypothetical protein